jgi:hypothetical protein
MKNLRRKCEKRKEKMFLFSSWIVRIHIFHYSETVKRNFQFFVKKTLASWKTHAVSQNIQIIKSTNANMLLRQFYLNRNYKQLFIVLLLHTMPLFRIQINFIIKYSNHLIHGTFKIWPTDCPWLEWKNSLAWAILKGYIKFWFV